MAARCCRLCRRCPDRRIPAAVDAQRPSPRRRSRWCGSATSGSAGRVGGHVQNLLKIPGCRITAVCDIRPERTDWATKQITAAGHPAPTVYNRGPRDFERLCETEALDLVYNATPWEFHVPIMLAAMKNGKHTATEVPAAMTVDDCWAIVEAAEKLQKHCVLMENCNYDRTGGELVAEVAAALPQVSADGRAYTIRIPPRQFRFSPRPMPG